MDLTPTQQAVDAIQRAKRMLIALPTRPSSDAIASGLALFSVLEKLGKQSRVVAENFELPPNHSFLPKSKEIESSLTSLRKFIISLDLRQSKVEELSYAIQGDKLNVYITPKDGFFEAKDVTTSAGGFEYDLIITLDTTDLEHLGGLFTNNAEFFYQTPILNIDHSPSNNHFGQIQLVDITATSTSEMVFGLIKALSEESLDELIATNLLTGIISKTKSFKMPSVTPKSLAIASHLIESGARREEIIKNLYQTKTIETLKLWGRALARLQERLNGRFVWATLRQQDFVRAGAKEGMLSGVIDDLIINTPKAEVILLLSEDEQGKIHGIVASKRFVNARELFAAYHPTGADDLVEITVPDKTLEAAEQELTAHAESYLKSLPG